MKRAACWAIAALAAAGCAAPPVPVVKPVAAPVAAPRMAAGPLTLVNSGFELEMAPRANCATGWACTMHADPKSFRFFHGEGAPGSQRSFCVEPITREPWAVITQGSFDPALRGMRLRFSISMSLAEVKGDGAGIWIHVQRPRAPMGHFESLAKTTAGWETRSVEFDVAEDAQVVEYGMTLRGKGRACFDDARLEVLRPAKNAV